jgi:hypothetical protein
MDENQVTCTYREDEGLFYATDPDLPDIAAGGETEAAARAGLEDIRRSVQARPDLTAKDVALQTGFDVLTRVLMDLPVTEYHESPADSSAPDSPAH